jgi:hypothetical protein
MVLVRVLEGEEDSAALGGGGGTLYRRTLGKVRFS